MVAQVAGIVVVLIESTRAFRTVVQKEVQIRERQPTI